MTLLLADTADPIQVAIDHYRDVHAYQVTVKSTVAGKTDVLHYAYKKPGLVRMDFVSPHQGAVLVYDPAAHKAKLWPFGYHSFPSLSLSPDNGLIRSPTGQRVDRSDVGVLFENAKALQAGGGAAALGVETVGGQAALHVEVGTNDGVPIGAVYRYQLWLDQETGFPVKVLSYGKDGKLIESVEMEGLQINPEFSDGFFDQ